MNAHLGIYRWSALLLGTALLASCAGYQSHREGFKALEEGRLADGVRSLQRASEHAPGDDSYRRDHILQRDMSATRLLRQADMATSSGQYEEAKAAYAEMQRFLPEDPRLLKGLNELEVAQRHARALEQAQADADRGDWDGAVAKARLVLSENPRHVRAGGLLKRWMRQQTDATGKELGVYPKLKAIYRKPVSLSFTGASVRQVFESLKLASGLNYVFDKDVQQDNRVTLAFTNKPVEDVLRLVLATNQLESRVLDSDTLLIYPNTPNKAADYREMVVRSFYLTNADVNKTAALIRSMAKVKEVHIDERLNLLVIRDSSEVVRLAEKLIATADMAEPEVMLELEVMEVNVNRLIQAGIQWPTSVSASVRGSSGVPGQLTLDEFHDRSKSLVRLNFGDPIASVQLRSQKGDSNVLANPRVRVRNRQQAKIMIGDKVPVITVTNTANVGTSESVSYLDVGLKLNIEPNITLDDEVGMKVDLEVSNIVDTITRATGTQTYRLGSRNTSTVLRVRDGETSVLAGLIQKEDRRSNTGVPGLNELPFVSKLFGAGQDSDSKTEIVLLITPRILRNIELPGVGLQEFGAGTENAVGAAPIQLGQSIDATQQTTPTAPAGIAPSRLPSPAAPPASVPTGDPSMPQPPVPVSRTQAMPEGPSQAPPAPALVPMSTPAPVPATSRATGPGKPPPLPPTLLQ